MNLLPEYLDEELDRSVMVINGFRWIHHPHIISVAPPPGKTIEAAYLNDALIAVRAQFNRLIKATKYEAAIMACIQRPYRTYYFDLYSDYMDNKLYWSLLATIYIDQENPEDFTKEWRLRFNAKRSHKYFLMKSVERKALANLAPQVTIYRAGLAKTIMGLSWTTSLSVASFFASRFGADFPIYQTIIDRENITAFWTRRNEYEVLVSRKRHLEKYEITLVRKEEYDNNTITPHRINPKRAPHDPPVDN